MIPIQSTIISFLGKPATVFCAYDEDLRILVVSVEADYRNERRDGCIVITNDHTIDRDTLLDSEKIQDAIRAFFAFQGGLSSDGKSPRLVFSEKAQRANPSDSIEKDGVDARGQRYRISEDISCAKVATLAACWYAHYHGGFAKDAETMIDTLMTANNLNQGYIFTI